MCSKRDIVIFFSGFASFDALMHLVMAMGDTLPIKVFNIIIDKQLNLVAMIVSALVAAGLYWWSCKLQ